jgi:hypothetical protein
LQMRALGPKRLFGLNTSATGDPASNGVEAPRRQRSPGRVFFVSPPWGRNKTSSATSRNLWFNLPIGTYKATRFLRGPLPIVFGKRVVWEGWVARSGAFWSFGSVRRKLDFPLQNWGHFGSWGVELGLEFSWCRENAGAKTPGGLRRRLHGFGTPFEKCSLDWPSRLRRQPTSLSPSQKARVFTKTASFSRSVKLFAPSAGRKRDAGWNSVLIGSWGAQGEMHQARGEPLAVCCYVQ